MYRDTYRIVAKRIVTPLCVDHCVMFDDSLSRPVWQLSTSSDMSQSNILSKQLNLLKKPHKTCPISRPYNWSLSGLLWIQCLIYALPMQYMCNSLLYFIVLQHDWVSAWRINSTSNPPEVHWIISLTLTHQNQLCKKRHVLLFYTRMLNNDSQQNND